MAIIKYVSGRNYPVGTKVEFSNGALAKMVPNKETAGSHPQFITGGVIKKSKKSRKRLTKNGKFKIMTNYLKKTRGISSSKAKFAAVRDISRKGKLTTSIKKWKSNPVKYDIKFDHGNKKMSLRYSKKARKARKSRKKSRKSMK